VARSDAERRGAAGKASNGIESIGKDGQCRIGEERTVGARRVVDRKCRHDWAGRGQERQGTARQAWRVQVTSGKAVQGRLGEERS
jgi:hypothetical protein